MPTSKVYIAFGGNRASATKSVVAAAGMPDLKGKKVFIKPNCNTADHPPGSTHMDTLRTVVELVNSEGPKSVTVGDRSGPASTRTVFEQKGILVLGQRMGFETLVFDEMPKNRWAKINVPGSHWVRGFWFAKPIIEADSVISLCCLKTHQYGGWFTMSLKLSTGAVHRRNMIELHTSPVNQRKMIAEMNYAYRPSLIIMDGVDAFYTGGPMTGDRWNANLTFASKDRVALDASGVATLKMHGTTNKLMDRRVFEQDQIRRAAELGLGASSPGEVELVPVDDGSVDVTERIRAVLEKG